MNAPDDNLLRRPDGTLACSQCLIEVQLITQASISLGGVETILRVVICPSCGERTASTTRPEGYREPDTITCPECGRDQRLTFRGLSDDEVRELVHSGDFEIPEDRREAALQSDGIWRGRCARSCQVWFRYLEVGRDRIPDEETTLAPALAELHQLQRWLKRADFERRQEGREMGSEVEANIRRYLELFSQHPAITEYERLAYGNVRQLAIIAEHHLENPELALNLTRLGLAVARVTDRQQTKARRRLERLKEQRE